VTVCISKLTLLNAVGAVIRYRPTVQIMVSFVRKFPRFSCHVHVLDTTESMTNAINPPNRHKKKIQTIIVNFVRNYLNIRRHCY